MNNIEYKLNADYPNYRTFRKAVMIRKGGKKSAWGPGYIAPEVRYLLDGEEGVMQVRYEDIPFFTSDDDTGSEHMRDILGAHSGKSECAERLESAYDAHLEEIAFDTDMELTENEFVVPCTSEKYLSEELVSHKGTMLLKLSRKDYPVPDFCILNSRFSQLDKKARRKHVISALKNLERLTGSTLGDAENPLVFAVRCAMPRYIPGLMPTFLNVGVTDDVFDALSRKHGRLVASKIRLNNMKTLYGLLYRDRDDFDTALVRGCLKSDDVAEIDALTNLLRGSIDTLDSGLTRDPLYQTFFFIDKAIEGFEQNSDLFYTFVKNRESFPSLILQKMVWTIIDNNSYPGVLYSRHSRTGLGRQVEFVRNIFGEEIMTGTIETKEIEYFNRAGIRDDFPAVYHFDPLLERLEKILASPVTVEFAAESGRNWDFFAVLQLNKAELTGRSSLLSAVDMFNRGVIDRERVISLIQPYHLRQIISGSIDDDSFKNLNYFCGGVSVLPRSAVSARAYFSAKAALDAKKRGEKICICKENFIPSDTIVMNEMDAIISVNPAAIHVVTACRSYGIPAFLNLEHFGVRMADHMLINKDGQIIREGDWITLSSKRKTVFTGRARFKTARFQKYLDGERFQMEEKEEKVFVNMARAFETYREIVENADLDSIVNLKDLVKLIRNDLRKNPEKASHFLNKWFDSHTEKYLEQTLQSELGTHQAQFSLYNMLTMERKIRFFKGILSICMREGLSGYNAGSFMLGRFICQTHPIRFWRDFTPEETLFLLNEYVLFEKYIQILNKVGERKVNRARSHILNGGLGSIEVNYGYAVTFLTLKLNMTEPEPYFEAMKKYYEAETGDLLRILCLPYGRLYDYNDERAYKRLVKLCRTEGVSVPDRDDV